MKKLKEFLTEGTKGIISSIGSANLKTGKNKLFSNMYDIWNDGTAEIWKRADNDKVVFIYTSDNMSHFKNGDSVPFYDDQRSRFLFFAKKLKDVPFVELHTITKHGKSLIGYTYK